MKLFAIIPLCDGLFVQRGRVAVLALALAGGCLLGAGRAQAQTVIDYYNFNDGVTTPPTRSTTYGDQTPTHTATTTLLSTNFPAANFVSGSGGTPINAQPGDSAGKDLIVSNFNNNGDYIQLQTSVSGYSSLSSLSYATYRSGTGFQSEALSYSFTGTGTYVPVGSAISVPTSVPTVFDTAESIDLSGINIQGQNNIYLKLTFSGATGTAGTGHIDNLTLSGNAVTPAPPGFVSAGIGFAVTGFGALLRRRKQSKSPDTATPEAA